MISTMPTNLSRPRTASCFGGGSQEPQPQPPAGPVEFSYNPQDKLVMAPGTTTVVVSSGPAIEKAELRSSLEPVDGKYVYDQSQAGYRAANSLAAVSKAISTFEAGYGDSVKWAFSRDKLKIVPDGGEMLNAYYSRQASSLNFFHSTDPVTKGVVYSGDSGEVVAHEAGHAILDGLRPSYLGAWSPDPGGFHESFGDVLAMIVTLQDDRCLDQVVAQTGGDLSKPNLAAALGEELGVTINHTTGKNATGGDYTRNAINSFTWQDPASLPSNAPHDQLSREVHSYSRLWTGAVYDILKGITDENLAAGQAPREAIRGAADDILKLYGGMLKAAPQGNFAYRDMARAMLSADASQGGKHTDLIKQVMDNRRILSSSEADSQSLRSPSDRTRTVTVSLDGPEYGQFSGATVDTVVDAAQGFDEDDSSAQAVRADLKKYIDAGQILFTTPDQVVSDRDLIGKDGNPYMGVVRWNTGAMHIERVGVLT